MKKNVPENVPKNVPENISLNAPKNGQKRQTNVPENVPENLNDTERRICEILKKNNSIIAKDMANLMNMTEKTIKRNIKSLKEKGYIIRVGSDRKGYWKILK